MWIRFGHFMSSCLIFFSFIGHILAQIKICHIKLSRYVSLANEIQPSSSRFELYGLTFPVFDRIDLDSKMASDTDSSFFIHSADPQILPVVIIIFAQISVRTSMCPTFQNIAKQNKRCMKIMLNTGGTVGLAEWIIDDTDSSCYHFFFFCLQL